VVAALEALRRDHHRDTTLTVVGPDRWPLPGAVPDGVDFRGRRPAAEVAGLYDTHDVLVVPSRLEGFGKVFLEALARGLPCVGRDAFAMPELIRPGGNGALVRSEDPAELAAAVAGVLADDDVYATCAAEAPGLLARYTWDRAAAELTAAIQRSGVPG
jgi:glycosyltransferase involved in cell wall biosynthesis